MSILHLPFESQEVYLCLTAQTSVNNESTMDLIISVRKKDNSDMKIHLYVYIPLKYLQQTSPQSINKPKNQNNPHPPLTPTDPPDTNAPSSTSNPAPTSHPPNY